MGELNRECGDNIRMSKETRKKFDEVCEYLDLNKEECFEQLINMYHYAMMDALIEKEVEKLFTYWLD